MTEPTFVAAGKASRILGVTTKTLSRWAKAKKITHYRSQGGRYYYDVSAYMPAANSTVKVVQEMAQPSVNV